MRYFTLGILPGLLFFFITLFIHGCATDQKSITTGNDTTGPDLRKTGTDICREVSTGRMWQATRSKVIHSSQEAEEYVTNLQLGGYSDWRLPTRNELYSLYYIFFWNKNGECTMKQKGDYWTAGEEGGPSPGHWKTEFLCSPVHTYVKSLEPKGYVRAVRP